MNLTPIFLYEYPFFHFMTKTLCCGYSLEVLIEVLPMISTTYVSIEKDFFVIFLWREKVLLGAMNFLFWK